MSSSYNISNNAISFGNCSPDDIPDNSVRTCHELWEGKSNKFLEDNCHLLNINIDVNKCIDIMMQYDVSKQSLIIILDALKVNESWKQTTFYICDYDHIEHVGDKVKLLKSRINLINLQVNEPPIIWLNDDGIQFENGRNRFANLRDSGITRMPFIVRKSKIHLFDEFI